MEIWNEYKNQDDLGLKVVLGLENQRKNIINATKIFLTEMWKKRSNEEQLRMHNRNVGEHNYNL